MGLELAGSIIGFTLVGYWVDRSFGSGRTGLVIGACLGIVGGMYNFLRQAVQLARESERARKREKGSDR